MALTFVTGPVRSGKSTFATRLAERSGLDVVYVATAARDDSDPEWAARLEHHRRSRSPHWQLAETDSYDDAAFAALFAEATRGQCLLVDSLGGWLSRQIFDRARQLEEDFVTAVEGLDAAAARMADGLIQCRAEVIAVGEQTGWGIVPNARSARAFRDVLGRLDQRLARAANRAYLVVAGYALDLKAVGEPV